MSYGKTLIYSHSDVDGIMSARIAQWTNLYREADVTFTPYIYFGTKGLDLVDDLSRYSNLVCLDIGSTEETLKSLAEFADKLRVFLFDHHPTQPSTFPKYMNMNFRISWDSEHCTSSLLYSVFSKLGMFADSYWPERWTIIGIYGDVAKEKSRAREVLNSLSEKHPDLVSQLSSDNKLWPYQPASMIARAINMVRRIGYHYGAWIVLNALKEIEAADDVFLPVRNLSLKEQSKYPYITLMRNYIRAYREAQRDIQYRLLDLDQIGVVIVTSKADIGGAVVRKAMRKLNKPVFVVNDGILENVYKLTGRSNSLDLNLVMTKVTQLSKGLVTGGGHPQAVSGVAPANIGLSRLVKLLKTATLEVTKDWQKNQS